MVDFNKRFFESIQGQIDSWMASDEGRSHPYANILGYAPALFRLLCRLSIDSHVPEAHKARLGAAIAYFVVPSDLIPESQVGPRGFADDIALAAFEIHTIMKECGRDVAQDLWQDSNDLETVIQSVLEVAPAMVGERLWNHLRRLFSTTGDKTSTDR